MSTTPASQEGNGASAPPLNVESIVPGSIFQDDIPPPTFMEGSSGYDPQTNNSTTTAGVAAASANGKNNTSSSEHVEIEVNSTIQTVLVTLGVCVAALFLLGVIATHYISHKNRRAEEKKMKALEKEGGEGGPGEALGVKEMKSGGGVLGRDGSRRGSIVTVCIDENTDGGAGVGPVPAKSIKGKGFTHGSPSPGSNHSPKCSIIGGIGTAVGGGGHAGTGSFQMGASGPRGPGSADPRNSFMEVAQVYARRQSITPTPTLPLPSLPSTMHSSLRAATPGYSHEHHHHVAPPDLHIGLYANEDPLGFSRSQELTSPMFALSPSSFGTDHPDRNPFASPPLSAGSKVSMFMDPFRTQNNSQLSLNLMTGDDNNAGAGDGDVMYPRSQSGTIAINSTSVDATAKVENDMSNMPLSRSPTSFPLQALSPSNGSPRSLDDLSEPKLILRHIHSAVPAYHRQTGMNVGSPSSTRSVTPNIFNGPPSSPVPIATAATSRPGMERQASFSPGVAHDRRSFAGSVVVTSGNGRQPSSSGSINEGNAWYRKRASVIIPEGGTAHVKLWKDGEISSGASIKNRSSRSGSQSSSQSQHSGMLAAVVPSPLRLNHPEMETERDLKGQQRQLQEQGHPDLSLKATAVSTVAAVARNGAAVFEGKHLNRANSSIPRSPSPSQVAAFGTVNAPLVVVQSERDYTNAERVKNSEEQEEVDQVVVRLRTPRRGSHTGSTHSNRQSYLDDYLEQQQQLQQQQ